MNPLLTPSKIKNSAVPFDLIKAEHYMPAIEQAMAKGRQVLTQLKKEPAGLKTLELLEAANEDLEYAYGVFQSYLHAHGDDQLRALAQELAPKVAAYSNDMLLDPGIFAKVKETYQMRSTFKAEARELADKVFKSFERNGADLDENKKKELRAVDEKLSALGPKFNENVLKSTNLFELWITDASELAGLPESSTVAAKEAAIEKGRPEAWLYTLHRPSYGPFLQFADRRELREKMYRAFMTRAMTGENDNRPVILEMVALMHQKAQLTGQKSFAAFALQDRMAESVDQVKTFLDKMFKTVHPAAVKDVAEVQAFAETLGFKEKIQAWDFAYYSEKLKQQRYSLDEEQLRPYFKLENVINGAFEIARRLYGIKFTSVSGYPVYHPEVQVYEVHREKNGEFIGLFYTDFFPRASKAQGAWMTNFREQGRSFGQIQRPHVVNVCNFTKPIKDKPSLLNLDELRTTFHEFGHGLHGLLSRVEYRSLAGTNVYRDFVELPSQIMENWAKEKEVLTMFARHYKTGEVIPDHLIQKMKNAERFQVGYAALRQLQFAYLDLAWYADVLPKTATVEDIEEKAIARCQVFPKVPSTMISSSFSHIFGGGYAAGYYSYKWAEALDADAFELFQEKGLFDPVTAQKFEEFILSKGGSDHPMRLYEQFRGRKPDPEALLRRDGLL